MVTSTTRPVTPTTRPSRTSSAAAYTNNIDGATTTALYDIDSDLNILAQQVNANGGTLSTIGALGVDTTDNAGFDIEQGTGVAYAALQATGDAESTFYRVNLMTGAATAPTANNNQIGPDGTAPLESVSLIPVPVARFANAATSVSENGATATISVVREGPLNQTATVNYATEIAMGDTATTGTDFTATNGTLTFVPGDAIETLTVPITDNAEDNANKTFTVRLSAPSASLNLQSPPTTQVTIVDDEATPGTLVGLVSVPFQTEKKVAKSKLLKYSFSCDQECSVTSSLQLKNGDQLATDTGALAGSGKSDETFSLSKAAVKDIKKAKGKKSVPLKIVSTFNDADSNQQIITTKFKLDR